MNNLFYVDGQEIDEAVRKYRNSVLDTALVDTAGKFAHRCLDEIKSTYTFSSSIDVDPYVELDFYTQHHSAHIRIKFKRFNMIRLAHVPPKRKERGYSTIKGKKGTSSVVKAFPLTLNKGRSTIMVTRSGIDYITEGWQERQAAYPLTTDVEFKKYTDLSRQTIFETTEKDGRRRKHTFRIVRTLSTTDIIEMRKQKLLSIIPSDMNVSIDYPRTPFRGKTKLS